MRGYHSYPLVMPSRNGLVSEQLLPRYMEAWLYE